MNLFDVESAHPLTKDFAYNNNVANAELNVRLGFVRKVYGIIFAQIAMTAVIVGTIKYFDEPVTQTFNSMPLVPFVLAFSTLGFLIVLSFKKHVFPLNYMLLFGFTLAESLLLGLVVALHSLTVVIQAFFLTGAIMLCLTFYTLRVKGEYSSWSSALFMSLFVLVLLGPINVLLGSTMLDLLLSACGALLFSLLIVYDTHRVMHIFSPEEYIIAAITLYLDMVNLFLHILRLLQNSGDQ